MTDTRREQISALSDSELSKLETDQTISQLTKDDGLRETWGRYHLIGDVIRGEARGRVLQDIAGRVRQQLETEPAILAAPKPKKTHIEWMSGAAIAASVAVLAIMAAPQLLNPDVDAPSHIVSTGTPAPVISYPSTAQLRTFVSSTHQTREHYVAAPTLVTAPNARWYTLSSIGTHWNNQPEPAVQNKLNKYLADHSEYAIQGGMTGMVPYATFVGYDARQ
ncbi:Sigma factor RpoE negative regulatory protein RseA [hydrothermal vent metagenome]|uniref:Sigma factor RpoE negative regulatory protein RseA n=1 Tax=hydrothermal vent metagenome TaxID=652676 RepID=A0A3B1BD60_9ZZZZ